MKKGSEDGVKDMVLREERQRGGGQRDRNKIQMHVRSDEYIAKRFVEPESVSYCFGIV